MIVSQNILAILRTFSNLQKKKKKKKALTKQTSTDATTEFLGKILNRK